MAILLEYRLRVRNAANTADDFTISSVASDTLPHLEGPPSGDGAEFDPLEGKSRAGVYSGVIVDAITSGTDRVLTARLEDATLRQQLLRRWAFWEEREDGGSWTVLCAGQVTRIALLDGIGFEVAVTDRIQPADEQMAFQPQPTDALADWLARWPNRGCLIGGPITGGGFLMVPDLGGVEVVVWSQGAGYEAPCTHLAFKAGYSPAWKNMGRTKRLLDIAGAINEAAKHFEANTFAPQPHFSDEVAGSFWPGILYLVKDPATGTVTYHAADNGWSLASISYNGRTDHGIAVDFKDYMGFFVNDDSLTVNQSKILRLNAISILPTEQSPIYWTGHPVDLLADLWDEAGYSYDATALQAVRESLGADRRLSIRITEPRPLATFLEETILGPFGIGLRRGSDGEIEPFASRIFANTPPTVTITDDDVDEESSGEVFTIEEQSAITRLVFESVKFRASKDVGGGDAPTDGLLAVENRIERANGDPGAVGTREVTFRIPGMVHTKDSTDVDISGYIDAIAWEVFDRWGRGIIASEPPLVLRGSDADGRLLGDEVLVDLSAFPNHNKRLGDDASVAARAMQVVRITRTPAGRQLRLLDSGPNAQPVATVPTHTIAASSLNPNTVAELTITNAATLNAATIGVELQIAVTTGGAPALTDYTTCDAYSPGEVPTAAIALPAVAAGHTMYARARSVKVGARPSNWSTGVSVTLAGIAAPSGLTATPDTADGSRCALAWTAGASTDKLAVEVFRRLSTESASVAVRVHELPATSVYATLEGLTPGTTYIAGVRYREPATGAVSATTEVSFTAGATTATLSAPGFESGFSGSVDASGQAQLDGVYGIAVVATERPGFVEVAEAVETAVGSGTFGSFATAGKVPSQPGGVWTIWSAIAPNDRLRRRLKARHVGDGMTESSYTSSVDVTPWTVSVLQAYPTQGYVRLTVLAPLTGEAATMVRCQAEWVDPAGTTGQVQVVSITANTSIATGTAVGTDVASPATWKFDRPTAGAGTGAAVFKGTGTTGSDEATLMIPEVGSDAPILTVSARILTNSATAPVYRVFVTNNGTASATVTLAATATGVSITSDPLPFTITAGGTGFADYTITIPSVAQPQGRVVWTATATGYVKGQDAANFGDRGVDFTPPTLALAVTADADPYVVSYTTNAATVEYSVNGGGAWFTITGGSISVARTSSQQILLVRATSSGGMITNGWCVIPSTATAGGGAPTAVVDRVYVSSVDTTTDDVSVAWSYSGSLGTGSFELVRTINAGTQSELGGTATDVVTTTGSTYTDTKTGTNGHGMDLLASGGAFYMFNYMVRVKDVSGAVLRSSPWGSKQVRA